MDNKPGIMEAMKKIAVRPSQEAKPMDETKASEALQKIFSMIDEIRATMGGQEEEAEVEVEEEVAEDKAPYDL